MQLAELTRAMDAECALLTRIACCPKSLRVAWCFKHYGCATVWRFIVRLGLGRTGYSMTCLWILRQP